MKSILLADADPMSRELLSEALRERGYAVTTVASGREAATICRTAPMDVLLLDLALTELDGEGVLRALRGNERTRSLPVVILTRVRDRARLIEAARLGVRGIVLKQEFSLRAVLAQLDRILAAPSATSGTAVTMTDAATPPPAATRSEPVSPDHVDARWSPTGGVGAPRSLTAASVVEASPRGSSSDREHPLIIEVPPTLEEDTAALKSLRPPIGKSRLLEMIDGCGELKGFSPAVSEVLKLTGNQNASIEQIAKAISRDHAIALKVLRLANSAVYTRGEPVDSMQKAVLRIGVGQIRQAVLNLALVERLSVRSIDGTVDGDQFWEHAIATGLIASEIARSRDEKEVDGAFTMGLLHDVGRMVLLTEAREPYEQVLEAAGRLMLPLEQVEQAMLQITHADVTARVFQTWKFSRHLITPITMHHVSAGNIRQVASNEATEVATLGLADRLAHAFMLGSSGNETIAPTEDLCELLDLDPSVVARIEMTARDETDKIKFALLARSNLSNWDQLNLVHQSQLLRPLRPLYVAPAPAIDAHRIFVEQLADWGDGEPANLGLIRFRNPRDREPMSRAYAERERAQGLPKLPLICLSAGGRIAPMPSLMEGRRVIQLSTPFTIRRFIGVVNGLLTGAAGAPEEAGRDDESRAMSMAA